MKSVAIQITITPSTNMYPNVIDLTVGECAVCMELVDIDELADPCKTTPAGQWIGDHCNACRWRLWLEAGLPEPQAIPVAQPYIPVVAEQAPEGMYHPVPDHEFEWHLWSSSDSDDSDSDYEN